MGLQAQENFETNFETNNYETIIVETIVETISTILKLTTLLTTNNNYAINLKSITVFDFRILIGTIIL